MHDFKSGDYDRSINRFFVVMVIVLAVSIGIAVGLMAAIKAGPLFY